MKIASLSICSSLVFALVSCHSTPPAEKDGTKDIPSAKSPSRQVQQPQAEDTDGSKSTRKAKSHLNSVTELPPRTYIVDVSASELMESDEAFDILAVPLKQDIDQDLEVYDIDDVEELKQLLGVRMNIAILQGDYQLASELIEDIRALERDEAKAMMTGLVMGALIDSREQAGINNPASEEIFIRSLQERINGMPWEVIETEVVARHRNGQQMNDAVFQSLITTGLDPMLQENGGTVSYVVARQLVTFKAILVLQLPHITRINAVYKEAIDANRGGG